MSETLPAIRSVTIALHMVELREVGDLHPCNRHAVHFVALRHCRVL